MRRASRHPDRFAPTLQSLEGRVVPSQGLSPVPPIAIVARPPFVRADLDAPGDAGIGWNTVVDLDTLDDLNAGRSSPFSAAANESVPTSKVDRVPKMLSFAFGRPPREGWSTAASPVTSQDEVMVGPPLPAPTMAANMTAPAVRDVGPSFERGVPMGAPRGAGAIASSLDSPLTNVSGPRPRGPVAPPMVVAADPPATAEQPTPAPPPPPSASEGSPLDLTRPVAAAEANGTAIVATIGTASTDADATLGRVAIAAHSVAPGTEAPAADPGRSGEAAPAESVGEEAEPTEDPAPIGSGVLEAFLPLDREAVDLALEKVLGQLGELGATTGAASGSLPLVLPVAAALTTAEAVRRWRARSAFPGPSIARGSRFSSLRGLS